MNGNLTRTTSPARRVIPVQVGVSQPVVECRFAQAHKEGRFDDAELAAQVSMPVMVLGDVAKVIVKAEVDDSP